MNFACNFRIVIIEAYKHGELLQFTRTDINNFFFFNTISFYSFQML